MSEKADAKKQVRIEPFNHKALVRFQKKLLIKSPIGSIANLAIAKGLVVLESERIK